MELVRCSQPDAWRFALWVQLLRFALRGLWESVLDVERYVLAGNPLGLQISSNDVHAVELAIVIALFCKGHGIEIPLCRILPSKSVELPPD